MAISSTESDAPDFSSVQLGSRSRFAAPIEKLAGAEEPIESFSRVVGTQRVSGQNNIYATCVPTMYFNAIQTVKGRAGDMSLLPDDGPVHILKIFDPTLTLGMDPEDLFAWAEKNTVHGYRVKSWRRIDHANEQTIRGVIRANGFVPLTVNLATAQQTQKVWSATAGAAGKPGSWGEHAELSDGCSGPLTNGTSWGAPAYIDRSYFTTPGYVLAAYALDIVKAA